MGKFTNGETVKCIDASGFAKGIVVEGNWYTVRGETPFGNVNLTGIVEGLDPRRFIHYSEAGGLIETPPKSLVTVKYFRTRVYVTDLDGKEFTLDKSRTSLEELIAEITKMVGAL